MWYPFSFVRRLLLKLLASICFLLIVAICLASLLDKRFRYYIERQGGLDTTVSVLGRRITLDFEWVPKASFATPGIWDVGQEIPGFSKPPWRWQPYLERIALGGKRPSWVAYFAGIEIDWISYPGAGLGPREYREIWIPLFYPLIGFAIFFILFLYAIRKSNPAIKGICTACGYDLRATPDRCPECGQLTIAK
jgi:hypothetical protein